jgi:hypothetical protein
MPFGDGRVLRKNFWHEFCANFSPMGWELIQRLFSKTLTVMRGTLLLLLYVWFVTIVTRAIKFSKVGPLEETHEE